MKKQLLLSLSLITSLLLVGCGQKGNHTGLVNTDYSFQKTAHWNIKYTEDEKALIEKRTHRDQALTLDKRTLKNITTQKNLINIDQGSNPKINLTNSPSPQMILSDEAFHDHQLNLPVVVDFQEDQTGITFILKKTLQKNFNEDSIDFCEMNNENNYDLDSFRYRHKISKDDVQNHLVIKDGKTLFDVETDLSLCRKVLAETYRLTFPQDLKIHLHDHFKNMGVELKTYDYLNLRVNGSEAILNRYQYLPLNTFIKIKEQLTFESKDVSLDINLSNEVLPLLPSGHYQHFSFQLMRPKKQNQTSSEHIVELKRDIIFTESCVQFSRSKTCEKGKVITTDIGPNIITHQEVISYEPVELNQDEIHFWESKFFTPEQFAHSEVKNLTEKAVEEIFELKKQRTIHYPMGNKPSQVLEDLKTDVVTSPKIRLLATKTFHLMISSERNYILSR